MRKIILIGAGGHAASCIDVIQQEKKFKILGLVDNNKKIGSKFMGFKILGRDNDLIKLKKITKYAFVAIGQVSTNPFRKKIFLNLKKLGFDIPKIISPHSYVSKNAKVGKGSIVHHGVIINALANIGNNCIINSKALIEHRVKVGYHTHVSTGCIINGDTTIEPECFLGSRSVIRHSTRIKKKSFIKMGKLK